MADKEEAFFPCRVFQQLFHLYNFDFMHLREEDSDMKHKIYLK